MKKRPQTTVSVSPLIQYTSLAVFILMIVGSVFLTRLLIATQKDKMVLFASIWFLLFLSVLILSIWAKKRVRSTLDSYNRGTNSRNMIGVQMARSMLDCRGMQHIRLVEGIGGYDLLTRTLFLPADVGRGTSIAALGMAAYLAGLVIQASSNHISVRLHRTAPVVRVNMSLSIIIIIAGLLLLLLTNDAINIVLFGISLFTIATALRIPILLVNFDISNRAKQALLNMAILDRMEILDRRETEGLMKVLGVAPLI